MGEVGIGPESRKNRLLKYLVRKVKTHISRHTLVKEICLVFDFVFTHDLLL